MEKVNVAIEFASKKMKLVLGYELNGKVYVLYTLTKPYGHIIDCGKFLDMNKVIQSVKEIRELNDPSAQIKKTIDEALLCLPPYGLEIFESKHGTIVVGNDSKIDEIDIRNIQTMIRNAASINVRDELIDIIPEKFILDQGRSFLNPPMRETSKSLNVEAKVHTLPKEIVGAYKNALSRSGITVRRATAAPLGAIQIISQDDKMPSDYLLVDIGSNVTTVSLVGRKQLFSSRYFEWGGDNITDKICEAFNINESDAEKYKITYGIDKREMNFRAPICITESDDGTKLYHYADDLNAIIKKSLDEFISQLTTCIDVLLEGYNRTYKELPIVMIGGGSRLVGLVDYVEPKIPNEKIYLFIPKILGARNPSFVSCLGLILANNKYLNVADSDQPRVGSLTRQIDK